MLEDDLPPTARPILQAAEVETAVSQVSTQHRQGLTHLNRTLGCKCVHRRISRCSRGRGATAGAGRRGVVDVLYICGAVKRAEGDTCAGVSAIALVYCSGPIAGFVQAARPTPSNDTRVIFSTTYICVLQLLYGRIVILSYLCISDSYDVSYLAFCPTLAQFLYPVFLINLLFVQRLDRRPCHC